MPHISSSSSNESTRPLRTGRSRTGPLRTRGRLDRSVTDKGAHGQWTTTDNHHGQSAGGTDKDNGHGHSRDRSWARELGERSDGQEGERTGRLADSKASIVRERVLTDNTLAADRPQRRTQVPSLHFPPVGNGTTTWSSAGGYR